MAKSSGTNGELCISARLPRAICQGSPHRTALGWQALAMTDMTGPVFAQLNIVVADMTATLAFYQRLGLTPTATPDGAHAEASLPGGLSMEWDQAEFAAVWDSGSRGPAAGGMVLGFNVPTRQSVDDL